MNNRKLFLKPFKVPYKGDTYINENVNFSFFALSPSVINGLKEFGHVKLSPLQFKAIPLGKCGLDLIIQAMSGTGKTCVFAVLSLETVSVDLFHPQVLILAPTREEAVQIMQVILDIGRFVCGMKVECFIGGTSEDEDVKKAGNCHIAVGTPGRIKYLVKSTLLNIGHLKTFFLDGADKLLSKFFASDIKYIREKISSSTQIIASSSTFPDYMKNQLDSFMRCPIHVCPESDETILHNVRQFVMRIKFHGSPLAQYRIKAKQLINILSAIPFKQCIVFSNYQPRAISMCDYLSSEHWPAMWIGSFKDQPTRLETMNAFRSFHCRVLFSTDAAARGLDVTDVNLIINLDVPKNGRTYLHRIGRLGRYGSCGIAVTLVNEAKEFTMFQQILGSISCSSFSVALLPPESLSEELWACDMSNFQQIYGGECVKTSVPLENDMVELKISDSLEDSKAGGSNECLNDSPEIYIGIIPVNDANTVDICQQDTISNEGSDSAESVSTISETSVKAEKNDSYKDRLFQSTELSEIPDSKNFASISASNTVNNVYAVIEIENSIEINREVENSEHARVREDSTATKDKLLPDISASSSNYIVKANEDKLLSEAAPVSYSKYRITQPVEKKCEWKDSNDFDYDEILSDYPSGGTGKSVSSQNDDSEGDCMDNVDRLNNEDGLEDSDSEDEMEESELEDEEGDTFQQYYYTLPSLEYPVNSSVNHGDYTQENASHTGNHHFEGLPECVPECAHPYLKYANWRKEMLKVKKHIQETEYMKLMSPYYHK